MFDVGGECLDLVYATLDKEISRLHENATNDHEKGNYDGFRYWIGRSCEIRAAKIRLKYFFNQIKESS